MAIKKIIVFTLVLVFHLFILGVVYISTREAGSSTTNTTEADSGINKSETTPNPDKTVSNVNTGNNSSSTSNNTSANTSNNSDFLIHVVGKGDYLGKIASKYKVSSKDIIKWNKLKNQGNHISLGQKLKIQPKK